MTRNQFIGVYVARSIKRRLRREAKQRHISISGLVNETLAKKFGVVYDPPADGRHRSGRLLSRRVRLSKQLRSRILASGVSRMHLASEAGYPTPEALTRMLRERDLILTKLSRSRLAKLASALHFEGPLYEEVSVARDSST